MHRSYKLFAVTVIAVVLLWACTTPAGRSAGNVVDDAAITTKVKAKFFEDKKLSGFAISVETFKGEVTLTGAVNSSSDKSHAAEVAMSVHGVTSVNNLLKVK